MAKDEFSKANNAKWIDPENLSSKQSKMVKSPDRYFITSFKYLLLQTSVILNFKCKHFPFRKLNVKNFAVQPRWVRIPRRIRGRNFSSRVYTAILSFWVYNSQQGAMPRSFSMEFNSILISFPESIVCIQILTSFTLLAAAWETRGLALHRYEININQHERLKNYLAQLHF